MSSSLTSKHRKQTESGRVDLVVRNARLLLESGLVNGGIGVTNGSVSVIASDEYLPDADNVIDAENKILMPGLIDAHAHIDDPTMQSHESFSSGSRAAAGTWPSGTGGPPAVRRSSPGGN